LTKLISCVRKVWAYSLQEHIPSNEISFKYSGAVLVSRREYLEEEKEEKDAKQPAANSENYTIFHALIEAMAKKEEKDSKRCWFLRKLRLSK
jgi:hypothetical protein